MSVAFYLDHHIDSAIRDGLRRRGVDVLTVHEDERSTASDDEILERAGELNRVVFTQDSDFLVLANSWQEANREFNGVIYVHQTNITVGRAIDDLLLIAEVCDSKDLWNRVEFIPL